MTIRVIDTNDFKVGDDFNSLFNVLYSLIAQNKKLDLYLLLCTCGKLGMYLFLV